MPELLVPDLPPVEETPPVLVLMKPPVAAIAPVELKPPVAMLPPDEVPVLVAGAPPVRAPPTAKLPPVLAAPPIDAAPPVPEFSTVDVELPLQAASAPVSVTNAMGRIRKFAIRSAALLLWK